MIENLPSYISITFALTTLATLILFYWTLKNSTSEATRKKSTFIILGLIIWLSIQGILTINNVYQVDPNALPPKIFLMGIFPAIFVIIILFITQSGRSFIDSIPLANFTYLHTIRIPVEIVLYWLFINKAIPELMTFEGRNFDILAGITAPFIAYFGIQKGKLNKKVILIWNFICLGLLFNIVINAALSVPSPFQKFAFDQPNIAILNFPFSWLPIIVVPIVLFGHLVSIRQLFTQKLIKE